MNYIKYTLLFVLLTVAFTVNAQVYQKVFHLNNGNILKGQIIEQDVSTIKVEIIGGSIFVIKKTDIIKVEEEKVPKQFRGEKEVRAKKDFVVKTTGYYHTISGSLLSGQDRWNDVILGASLHYTFGYQYNRWIGAGIGVGLDSYFFYGNEKIYPIYLEARGYLSKKPFSPYYSVSAGYGIAALDKDWESMQEADGGLYFHPKLGFRFPSRSNVAFTFEVGYNLQNAYYIFDNGWSRSEDDLSLRRTSIRFGLIF